MDPLLSLVATIKTKEDILTLPYLGDQHYNEWAGCFAIPVRGPRAGMYLFADQEGPRVGDHQYLNLNLPDLRAGWVKDSIAEAVRAGTSVVIFDPWTANPEGRACSSGYRVLHDARTDDLKRRFEFFRSVEKEWY